MIDLHCHSTFSFRDGLGTPEQIYARMEELGREVMCLTEHDNIYSAAVVQHTKPDKLKAIFGCEIRTVQNIELMRENKQRKKNHLTLLAKTTEGYGNICKLITFANLDGHYYFPTIDFDVLNKYKEGIIVLSGCPSSYLYELILSDRVSEAVSFCKEMKSNLDGNFYLEIMPHDLEMVHKATPVIRAISKKLDIPMVLTNDSHFLDAKQAKIWKLIRAIRLNTTFDQIDNNLQTCYYMTDDEAWEHAQINLGPYFTKKELLELFNNQERIASDCDAIIPKVGSADSGIENPFEELKSRTYQGLIDKGLDKPLYRERLEKELDLVGRKNFADYFLVVSDLVRWCKSHDILVGPSRGSAGGFLTSYCIDIIDLDPIPHDLVMERFLSEERVDPPDIDIDFQSTMRDQVILHMQEVYGDKNVAHITTFQHYKGKNTLIDVGKAYGIPPYEVKKVANVLLERGRADARVSATIEDTFAEFAQAKEVAEKYPGILDAAQLEGLIRHAGVNAAGVLVTKLPLDKSCSLMDKEGKWVASVDLDGAYSLDILKLDILAIKELDILKELCESTGTDETEIFHLPLDDRPTLDVFEGDTLGVFQFGATGTSSLIKQLVPINSFGDITLANALCLAHDTEIRMVGDNGVFRKPISEIEVGEKVISTSPDGKDHINEVANVYHKGTMSVYRVKTKDDRTIDATLDHGFYTPDDWKKLRELLVGDELTIYWTGHFKQIEIESIEYIGEIDCYDLSMKDQEYSNYIANDGFIVHNSRPGPLHCVSGNTWLHINNKKMMIRDAYIDKDIYNLETKSILKNNEISYCLIKNILFTGIQKTYDVILSGGFHCKVTLDHRFLTSSGWIRLKNITFEDKIAVYKDNSVVYLDIISIICSGEEDTYDIEMQQRNDFISGEPNYLANDIVVHNSGQAASITKAKSEGSYRTWNTGKESVDDILNEITKDTYGFMVFQEQIMRAMKEIGDFTWEQVAKIRGAMSKSLGDEYFNKFRQTFVDGSNKLHGLSSVESNEIFDHAIHFGNWAFNKAHSVGYSLISFATAYFKAHHPREFYRSLCNFNSDDKLKALLREYIERGYGKVLPPKIGKSGYGWTIEGNDLRGGLKDIIPEMACKEILSLYPIKDEDDLLKRAQRRKVNKRVWEIIEANELFSDNDNLDPYGLYEFAERMSRIKDRTHKIGELGYSFQFRDVIIAGVMDRQFNEKSYAELMQSQKTKDFSHLRIDEYGDAWGIMSLVDETGIPINVHFKNKTYPKFRDWIWAKKEKEDIIVVKGLIPPNMNYVIVKDAWDGEEGKADGAKCIQCPLIDSIFVPPTGNKNANIMLLGMVPGRDEVKEGEPFVGAAGKLLSELIIKAGTRRDKLWITNACLCRSATEDDKNRDPTDEEIYCCNERLMREIDEVQPKTIVTLGKLAYKALTGEDKTVSSIDGKIIEWGDFTVIPTYHPASCLYSDAETKRLRIKQALESAIEISRKID